MATISKVRQLTNGIPTTIDLAVSANVLQAWDFQIANTAVTASKPMKLDSNKKFVSGDINLASEVTGQLPYANMSITDGDLTIAKTSGLSTALSGKIASSEKGAASGVAPLGTDSKIAAIYLPSYVDDVLEYANLAAFPSVGIKASVVYDTVTFTATDKGILGNTIALVFNGTDDLDTVVNAWNLANPTNTVGFTGQAGTYVPSAGTATLTGGIDIAGETGKVYVALDTNKSYRFSGNAYVEVSPSDVNSVNGKTGILTLVTDDIAERSDPAAVNVWFTAARAQGAVVTQSITDGVTTTSPSENAVYDALAGKSDTGHNHTGVYAPVSHVHATSDITNFATDVKSAAVVNSTAGTQTDQAASVSAMKSYVSSAIPAGVQTTKVAGESFSANVTYVVRYAISGETAGRVYKASKLVPTDNKFWAVGLIQPTVAVSAGDSVTVISLGDKNLLSGDSNLAASSEGLPIFLQDGGAFSTVDPASGLTAGVEFASVVIGNVSVRSGTVTDTIISIQPRQLMGVSIA